MLSPMEENESLNMLNDETFGSDSFGSEWIDSEKPDSQVNEFEEWKKRQRMFGNQQITADEAPPREEDEEKMAQAISKLDSIGILSPDKEQDTPLPNAHAIEALWPTSPKHSSNMVTPDHSPYISDLLSPTHNIWGSPTSDEKTALADEKEEHPFKNHLDQEDGRKLYSPVLEDEAIVSALPKRVSNPIRVEDLEKIGFGHQVKQLPPNIRPFMNGAPKVVRPPPGFPPNISARSPFPLQSTPYARSPIPPVPQNVTMAQAQAQALYTAMMNQRMAFPQPFPRTPPAQHPHFPRPVYRSDPAHLRQRGPPMNIPHQHGRFITPQSRHTWNNVRGGRFQDNRRRQQNHPESPNFRYVPQYYVGSDDDDEDDLGTLMTAKEKDWIIRIQLMQLTSDKPELDDYYFHTFERRRLAKERSQNTSGVELETNHTNKDIEMTLPHVTKGEQNYKPRNFEGSLGQVSVGSVFHPREVVQVGDAGKPRGPVGSLKETKKKYQLLLTIEKGFDQILPIQDLQRMVLQVPQDVRPQLRDRRERLCQRCFDLLNLKPSKDSNKTYDDGTLLQMLSVRKGKRLLSKILRIVREDQRHEIALAITRNLRVFTKKDIHQEETESLSDAVVDVIRSSSSEKIIAHHNNVVGAESSALQLFVCKFTLRILAVLLKRICELLKNIDGNSLQLQTLWFSFLSVVCQDFVSSSPKILVKNYDDVQNIVDVLSSTVDDERLMVIKEHFRLVEDAQIHSPQR